MENNEMEVTNIDERGTFKGNDEQLCNCINALIELNDKRATTPPVPAFAVSLLIAASDRLATKEAENAELRAKVAQYAQALVNHNDVLRSAYQIAARKGAQTERDGFTMRAGSVLHFHHDEAEAARATLAETQPDERTGNG